VAPNVTINYQWVSSTNGTTWSAITGATATSYTLTQAEVGKQVTVQATYTDLGGYSNTALGNASAAVANINDAPTNAPVISGTPTQGQLLTAAAYVPTGDIDGVAQGVPVSYQWVSSADNGTTWNAISGATNTSYTLTQAEVGKLVDIQATYVDLAGFTNVVLGTATTAVANINDAPTNAPSFSGTATQGQTLNAATYIPQDLDGVAQGVPVSYQWVSSANNGITWNAISGATNTSFTLTQAEVGKLVNIQATYTDLGNYSNTVLGTATTAVANINDAPTNAPVISGTATQNQTLTVAAYVPQDPDGVAQGVPVSYQWVSSADNGTTWTPINLATNTSYTLTQAEVGKLVDIQASYVDQAGYNNIVLGTATTPVVNVNDPPTGTVTISGTVMQYQTLTASNNLFDPDGIPAGGISYQWQAGGSNINGAIGSTFTLTQAEVNKVITVVASYTDLQGTAEAVSSTATIPVINVIDPPVWNSQAPTYQARISSNTLWTIDLATLQAAVIPNFTDPEGTPLVLDTRNLSSQSGLVSVVGNTLEFTPGSTPGPVLISLDVNDSFSLVAFSFIVDVQAPLQVTDSNPVVTLSPITLDATIYTPNGGSITGNALDNILLGFTGNDILKGGEGNNTLNGGAGADTMSGGSGNDTYYVDNVGDTIIDTGGINTVMSSLPVYTLAPSLENLTLYGSAPDQVGIGNDANNVIIGSSQNNQLFGGAGNDVLTGGAGQDVMEGGAGNDTFVFLNAADSTPLKPDQVLDFTSGQDTIDLSAIDANSNVAGHQSFHFVGNAAFSGTAGELRFSDGTLSGDTTGSGHADFAVKMIGVETLFQTDLIV
jgi:Ca2+-binding RTX toxin-like protein